MAVELRHADLAIVPSRPLAERLRGSGCTATIALVPCGVDPAVYTPRADAVPDNGRWLFVGRLDRAAGLEDLLDALWLPDAAVAVAVAVDIVGVGPLSVPLMTRAAALRLGERVRFLGARDGEWLRAAGPAYRGLVAPGDADGDPAMPSSLALKQAMAMGLPVVAARAARGPDILDARCGRTVPPGDPAALARALGAIDRLTPAERRAMGLAGRDRVERLFSAARQGEQLSRLVEAV